MLLRELIHAGIEASLACRLLLQQERDCLLEVHTSPIVDPIPVAPRPSATGAAPKSAPTPPPAATPPPPPRPSTDDETGSGARAESIALTRNSPARHTADR